MKKFEVTEEFIKEAHKAACGEWRERIEKELPDIFGLGFNKEKTYIFVAGIGGSEYKLQRIGGEPKNFAWIGLRGSVYYANGTFETPARAFETASTIYEAENTKEYYAGNYKKIK